MPTRSHCHLLEPNYEQYWVADSEAVNNLDYYEMLLSFTSRGDECLNCDAEPIEDFSELILRIPQEVTEVFWFSRRLSELHIYLADARKIHHICGWQPPRSPQIVLREIYQ